MQELIIVFIVGAFASFFGIIAGGAGLITIPLLLLVGLPPQITIATNRFGSFGLVAGGLTEYLGKGQIIWKYVWPLTILQVIGGVVGANLLVEVSEETIRKSVAIAIFIILPLLYVKRDWGVKEKVTSFGRDLLGYIAYFINSIYTGFLGAGSGSSAMIIKMGIFRLTLTQAVATGLIPFALGILGAVSVFAWHGLIDWGLGFSLLIGMWLGSFVGARVTITKGAVWAKSLFVLFVAVIAVYLLLF